MKDSVKKVPSDPTTQPTSSRSYPRQAEGDSVTKYLNDLPRARAKQHPFVESVNVLRKLEQAVNDRDMPAVDRLLKNRRVSLAYECIFAAAIPTRLKDLRFTRHKEGLILQPTTPKAQAAVALLVLNSNDLVGRIRQCLHCRMWFYARFRHQQFCNDSAKKCQWNHYHSPEWRKQHREQNRKHQAAYRERLFG